MTTEFPQYFAIITRIRQEVHAIGPEGGMVNSTVVPQIQAVFPEGALTKKIKVGLQVRKRKNKKNDENHNSNPDDIDSGKGRNRQPSKFSLFGFGRKRSKKTEDKPSSQTLAPGNEISKITITTQDATPPISEIPGEMIGDSNNNEQVVYKKVKNVPQPHSRDAKQVSGCWADLVRVTMPNLDLFTRMV